jgi:PST family polysaccharide transporter
VISKDRFEQIAGTAAVRDNLKKRSVLGAGYLVIGTIGDFVVRLGSVAVLARLLLPEQFGLLGMVTAVTGIAAIISQLGLSTATVQRSEITHEQVTNLFWINVGFGLVLTIVIGAAAPIVARFYGDQRLVPITIAVATTFFWSGLAVQHEALLTRQIKQAQSAFTRLTATILSATLAIILAAGGYGYWALVWQEVARSILITAGIWICCPWCPGLPYRHESIRSLVRFGADLTAAQLFYAIVSNIDRLVLGRLFGPATVGMYRQAQQLVTAPIEQLNGPIMSVSQPVLSMLQNDPARYRRYYSKILFLIAFGTMPMAAFGAVYAEELTLMLLGTRWSGAAPLFRIFALAALIRPVLGTAGIVVLTCGRSRRLLVLTFASQLVLVLFIFLGIGWQAQGVAMAYLLTAATLLLPNLYFSFKDTPVTMSLFFRTIGMPAAASALMVAALFAVRSVLPSPGLIESLFLGAVIGGIVYLAASFSLPGGRSELSALIGDLMTSISYKGRRKTVPAPDAVHDSSHTHSPNTTAEVPAKNPA